MYNGRRGTVITDTEEDTGGGVLDASSEKIVLERVKTFAGAMLKSGEVSDNEDDTSEGEKEVVHSDVAPDTAQKDHEELMRSLPILCGLVCPKKPIDLYLTVAQLCSLPC